MSKKGSVTVYLIFLEATKIWLPIPFSTRELANDWAMRGWKEGDFSVSGYRLRS